MKTLGRERFLWRPRLAVTSLRSVERQVRPDLVRSHPAVQQSVGAQRKWSAGLWSDVRMV